MILLTTKLLHTVFILCYGSWVFFNLYFYPSFSKSYVARGNTHMHVRTHTVHTQGRSQTLISILISLSHCCSFTPPALSQRLTSHERGGPPPRGLRESRLLPHCTPTSMHNSNNRPCHWNKSQSSSVSGPNYAHSNFISPEQKIGARGINLWSISNILPTIQAALGVRLNISVGVGWQFAWDVLHYNPKNDKIGHTAGRRKQA